MKWGVGIDGGQWNGSASGLTFLTIFGDNNRQLIADAAQSAGGRGGDVGIDALGGRTECSEDPEIFLVDSGKRCWTECSLGSIGRILI